MLADDLPLDVPNARGFHSHLATFIHIPTALTTETWGLDGGVRFFGPHQCSHVYDETQ